MKFANILICVVMVASSGFTIAQDANVNKPTVINVKPSSQNNGFLALSRALNPEVNSWRIKIYRVPFGDGDKSLIDGYNLFDVNFVRLPQEYYFQNEGQDGIEIEVFGVNSADEIIISESFQPIPPGGFSFPSCTWGCVADDHAFQITQYDASGTSHILALENHVKNPSIPEPYYRYMNQQTFNQINDLVNTNIQAYYDFCYYHNIAYFSVFADGVIKINNAAPGDYDDMNGNPLQGPVVYGVQKALGPWQGVVATSGALAEPFQCNGETLLPAIDFMNLTYDFVGQGYPELYCAGAYLDPNGDNVILDGATQINECLSDIVFIGLSDDNDNDDIDTYNDWGSYTQAMVKCVQEDNPNPGGNNGNSGGVWNENIDEIVIVRLDEPGTYVSISEEDLFNSAGEYTGFSFSTEAGLYKIIAHLNDGNHYSAILEQRGAIHTQWVQADFLEALAFPNPVVNDEFDVNISATAKLKFKFKLINLNNEELYSKNFVVNAGHNRNHTIKPKKDFIQGQYIGKFEFEDGSVKTINILKN